MVKRPIEPNLRLVFVHLPKTGGTTLHHHFSAHFTPDEICPVRSPGLQRYTVAELAQWRYFSGHFNADEIKRIPGPVFIVTVLRNPIERLLSHYYFWKRHTAQYIERLQLRGPKHTRDGTLLDFLRSTEPTVFAGANNRMARQLAGQIIKRPGGGAMLDEAEDIRGMTDLQIVHRALENLLSFDVFGDISKLKEIYSTVAETFLMAPLDDLARLNTRDQIDDERGPWVEELITPEIRALLQDNTRLDRIIYQLAYEHWQKSRLPLEK
jgi:Sulfotransferase family